MKKLEEGFGSSKRTLINNPPKRIHELYFMPTDLQRHFYRKRGAGRHFRKGGNIPSRGSPQADFETEIVAKGQQWQHGMRMEAERVNAFARDVHFVKFNVSIKKPIVKILEWGGVGWQEKWSMQSVWQSFAGFTVRGILQNQSIDIQRGNWKTDLWLWKIPMKQHKIFRYIR